MNVRSVTDWAAQHLHRMGIHDRGLLAVLCVMILEDVGYWDCVHARAEYTGNSWARVNADLCYGVLKAGLSEHPSVILSVLLDQYRREHCEN